MVRWTHRRGRDRLPGLVPADRQVVLDEHEHRRPARALHLPPHRPTWWSNVQWRVRAVRRVSGTIAQRPPVRLVRPVEPDVPRGQPDADHRADQAASQAISDHTSTPGSPKAHELMPSSPSPVTRAWTVVRTSYFRTYVVDRPRLRQHRLQGLGHRQPGVRAADVRPAEAADRRDAEHRRTSRPRPSRRRSRTTRPRRRT